MEDIIDLNSGVPDRQYNESYCKLFLPIKIYMGTIHWSLSSTINLLNILFLYYLIEML